MKMDYTDWSSVMKVKLQTRQMWDAIGLSDVDEHKDR